VLPVAALVKQYKENSNPMIRHFDLVFVQHSIGKLTSQVWHAKAHIHTPANKRQEQLDLLPVLLHGLSQDDGKPTCATVFNLFLRLLVRLRLPPRGSKEDTELRTRLGLDQHQEDAKFVSLWFGKLLLLKIVKANPSETGVRQLPPGLTATDYEFLTLSGKAEAWDPDSSEGLNLTDTKLQVLSFLGSGAFEDAERFMPALFAASDSNSRISTVGEDQLKRSSVSLEDESLITNLFITYHTARPALKIRILSALSRSVLATTFPHQILGIVKLSLQMSNGDATAAMGLEATKLRNGIFNLLSWMTRVGSRDHIAQVSPALVYLLRDYIEVQGWPLPHEQNADQISLRALAYETIGAMAKTVPSIVCEPSLTLVLWLFRSLTEDRSSNTISISIEEALTSLINAFDSPLDRKLRDSLRSLLLEFMTKQEDEKIVRSARFAAVRWANRCLDYSDVVARWIDILAVGGHTDERSDVMEEGGKGLDPYWYRLLKSSASSGSEASILLPPWDELVKVFFTGQSLMENSFVANSTRSGMEVDGVSVFGNFGESKINAYPHAVSYCRRILLLMALDTSEKTLIAEADWERQLEVLVRTDKASRNSIRRCMAELDPDALTIFLSAALEGILWNGGAGLGECTKSFVELASLAPGKVLASLASRARDLMPAIGSNDVATRFSAAQAFGMLAPHPSNTAQDLLGNLSILAELTREWESAIGAEANKMHGAILAVGFCLSRAVFFGREHGVDGDIIDDLIKRILQILKNSREISLKEAAMVAVAHLSAANLITEARIEMSGFDKLSLIKMLGEESKKGNEKAITALGRLHISLQAGVENSAKSADRLLEELYALHELRQTEIQFTIGEALACAAAGWQSDSLMISMDVDVEYVAPASPSLLDAVMSKLLLDCKNTKPSLKKASGVWLFCLVQYCGHLVEVQSRLRECQAAFMGLLSARDDIVQETASRGLSLVYEQGDEELKKRLVSDLVASFTGTRTQLKVDEETELFEPGALPTGDGQSITSYKDIMSLAAEVGDQSLVYKFMSLASNAATWSTRAAFGRFGLSSILSESEVDPKLYPKLFRYRFDPNPNVQRSMNDIWSALVKNPTAVIDEHFDAIMEDLLRSILGKEWRTRQASCAAIADLVQGRRFEKYEKYLARVWDVALKVLDDIKGSVRKAAESLCQVLTNILVRQLEEGTSSKNAQIGLTEVMPFLFSTRGLESPSKEVQKFAYDTVLKLIKSGGKSLLPFIPSLVEQILGLLSTLEPDVINYIHLNAAKYDTTEEKIDEARSRMVSHSPMMEAIERCLDLLDEPTMQLLVPRLESVIKTAIGMPSKVGCSGVLVSLATRHSFIFRPHADVFIKDLEKAVLDRNTTVSAAYARATGYIARLASDDLLLQLATYSRELFLHAEDESRRQISAEIIYAVSKFATDRFSAVATEYLPFVFLAKHDIDEHVREQFQKTWDENVGGSRAVRLYLREILTLSSAQIESPKWAIKHMAALTIADVVNSAGDEMNVDTTGLIWPSFDNALTLKTFEGKEKLLEAFVKFTASARSFWEHNNGVALQMKKIAIREAKRNNEAYRPHAFRALGQFVEERKDVDMFDETFNVIEPRLKELLDEDAMDITTDTGSSTTGSKAGLTITAGVEALFRAINIKNPSYSPIAHLPKLLELLQSFQKSSKVTVSTQTAVYERTKVLFDGLSSSIHGHQKITPMLALSFFSLLDLASGAGNELLRTKRAEAAKAIAMTVAGDKLRVADGENVVSTMVEEIRQARKEERTAAVQALLDQALKSCSGE
jgi:proteasome component ECM29